MRLPKAYKMLDAKGETTEIIGLHENGSTFRRPKGEITMRTLESMLAEHPFFQGFNPNHLHMLAHSASEDKFGEQEYIFSEGEKAGKFYTILKGKVALEVFAAQHGQITIETLAGGEVLGWSWLFPPYRWQFSARVVEPTQVIVMDGVYLRDKAEEDHDFGYELVKRVAPVIVQRFQATRLQLLDVYGVYGPHKRGAS
jgi:CRP/FNR family transcriptional regulator, cyclic AMP receptor protein